MERATEPRMQWKDVTQFALAMTVSTSIPLRILVRAGSNLRWSGHASSSLNGLDPEGYRRSILAHIADHPVNRVDELLPGTFAHDSRPCGWRRKLEFSTR